MSADRFFAASFASLAVLASLQLHAQQSATLYDAPLVVLGFNEPPVRALLDADGDGDMDALGLRVVNGMRELALYGNDGTGAFASAWKAAVAPAGPDATQALAIGDLDGDARADFALGTEAFVLCYASNGLAAPALAAMLAIPPELSTYGYEAVDVELLDVNGDGLDEIVAMTRTGLAVYPSPFSPSGGAAPTSLVVSPTGYCIRLVKMQADAQPALDVAVQLMSPEEVRLYTLPHGIPTLLYTWSLFVSGCTDVAAGDIDSDGDDDLVGFLNLINCGSAQGYKQSILRQVSPGLFAAEPLEPGGPGHELADIDLDGDLDASACFRHSSASIYTEATNASMFRIATNDGSGRFSLAASFEGLGAWAWCGVDDLDGDADLDLIAGRAVYYGRSSLLASHPLEHATPASSFLPLSVADLDGEGDPDLVAHPQSWLRNDGAGSLSAHALQVLGAPPNGLWFGNGRAGDWDGDGDIDLIEPVNFAGMGLDYLLRNRGGGAFDWGPVANASGGVWHVLVPSLADDVDLDGDLDLLLTGSTLTELWANDGTGSFSLWESHPETVRALADLSGDGLNDWVGLEASGHCWIKNLGNLQFAPTVHLYGLGSPWGPLIERMAVDDLDGDGDVDLLYVLDGHVPLLLLNDGSGGLAALTGVVAGYGYPTVTAPIALALDVDDDGLVDLAFANAVGSSNTISVQRRLPGPLAYAAMVTHVARPDKVVDLDGDGDLDLLSGTAAVLATRYVAPKDGLRLQSGQATPDPYGIAPNLGATGPFRPGELVKILSSGGPGLGVAIYALSTDPLVPPYSPATLLLPFVVAGPSTLSGTGKFSLTALLPPALAGLSFYQQAFYFDLASSTITSSSRLWLRIGD